MEHATGARSKSKVELPIDFCRRSRAGGAEETVDLSGIDCSGKSHSGHASNVTNNENDSGDEVNDSRDASNSRDQGNDFKDQQW